MGMIDPVLIEFKQEMATTRRMLERVPEGDFEWRPHEKSMSLGRLATHVAELPGWVGGIVNQDEYTIGMREEMQSLAPDREDLLAMFDRNVAMLTELLRHQSDEHLEESWRLLREDKVLLEMPRWMVIRMMLLNHIIHHRGQLSVYLRLRGVALPSVYGPTADEQ